MHSNLLFISCPQPTIFTFPPNSHLSFNTHLKKSTLSLHTSTNRFRSYSAAVSSPETDNFYELLGIPESVTQYEIKVAYKQMALKYHPDVSPPDRREEHTKKFIRVQEAYETLSDPSTRAEYDCNRGSFAGRSRVRFDERSEGWKERWKSQIMGLKKRSSMRSNSKVDPMDSSRMSWGERIRKRRSEAHGSE